MFLSHIFIDLALFPLKIHCNPCHSIQHISFIEDPIPGPLPEAQNFTFVYFVWFVITSSILTQSPSNFATVFPNSASLALFEKFSPFTPLLKFTFFVSLSLRKCPQPSYPLTFSPTQNFPFLKPSLFLFFYPFPKKNYCLWLSSVQEKIEKWKKNLSTSRTNSKICIKYFSTSIFSIQP